MRSFLPPFHPFIALPVVGTCSSLAAIHRSLVATTLDENTLVPLGMAVLALITICGWIFWYATERERTRNRMRTQANLLEYLCEHLPQIDEKHGEVRRLLIEMKAANKSTRSRDARGT